MNKFNWFASNFIFLCAKFIIFVITAGLPKRGIFKFDWKYRKFEKWIENKRYKIDWNENGDWQDERANTKRERTKWWSAIDDKEGNMVLGFLNFCVKYYA